MVYRNRIAIFVWVFSIAWIGMLASLTLVLMAKGPPDDRSPAFHAGVLGFFWLCGIGLAAFALRQSCITVRLFDDGGLEVRQRFPMRVVRQRFAPSMRPRAYVTATTDSEGDPYFLCELGVGAPFRRPLRVAEGDRERCEAACRHLNDARR